LLTVIDSHMCPQEVGNITPSFSIISSHSTGLWQSLDFKAKVFGKVVYIKGVNENKTIRSRVNEGL
jgi:hypothetical protein